MTPRTAKRPQKKALEKLDWWVVVPCRTAGMAADIAQDLTEWDYEGIIVMRDPQMVRVREIPAKVKK